MAFDARDDASRRVAFANKPLDFNPDMLRDPQVAWDQLWGDGGSEQSPMSSAYSSLASTTDPSPANGTADTAHRTAELLSTPLDAAQLEASLAAWSSISFDARAATVVDATMAGEHDATRTEVPTPRRRSQYGSYDSYSPLGAPSAGPATLPFPLAPELGLPPHVLPHASPDSGSSPASQEAVTPQSIQLAQADSSSGKAKAGRRGSVTSKVRHPRHGVGTPDEGGSGDDVDIEKRRRNTEASARFRVRKKQREAALAASATELHQRVTELESEVTKLQVENGILRGLITDRG